MAYYSSVSRAEIKRIEYEVHTNRFLFVFLLANDISRLFHMHFANPNELSHIKSLTKQRQDQTTVHHSLIANGLDSLLTREKFLLARINLFRCRRFTTAIYARLYQSSISCQDAKIHLSLVLKSRQAGRLETPSVSPLRVSNQPM